MCSQQSPSLLHHDMEKRTYGGVMVVHVMVAISVTVTSV